MIKIRLRHVPHELREIRVELVAREDTFRASLAVLLLPRQRRYRAGLSPSVVAGEHKHRPGVLAEQAGQIKLVKYPVHVLSRIARSPQRSHECAHARAHNPYHGDAVLLERLNDSQVGKSLRASAREYQNNSSFSGKWTQCQHTRRQQST